MKQSKWHVGQRVIVWSPAYKTKYSAHPEERHDFQVTAVGRRWVTAKECGLSWAREHRFDSSTRRHEKGLYGRMLADESEIDTMRAADQAAQLRRERVSSINAGLRDATWQRMDNQPDSVLDMFEAALRAAGWWKE